MCGGGKQTKPIRSIDRYLYPHDIHWLNYRLFPLKSAIDRVFARRKAMCSCKFEGNWTMCPPTSVNTNQVEGGGGLSRSASKLIWVDSVNIFPRRREWRRGGGGRTGIIDRVSERGLGANDIGLSTYPGDLVDEGRSVHFVVGWRRWY